MRISLLYELQRARPGNMPDAESTYREAIEQAVLADNLGFHTFWVTEHHFLPGFALSAASDLVLAAIAQRTERIRIGAGVVVLPYHHPVQVAERMATLDLLSNGRLEFGTGRGGVFEQLGFDVDPRNTRDMWAESLDAILQMWETYPEEFEFQGKFWNVPPRIVIPQPKQEPHPALWVAALQEETYTLAAERGMGVLAFVPNSPSLIKPHIARYHEQVAVLEATGRTVNNKWASFTYGYCDADNAEGRETARTIIRNFFGPGRPYVAALAEVTKGILEKWGGDVPEHLKAHFAGPPGSTVGGNTGTGLGTAAQNATAAEGQEAAIWDRVDADTLSDMALTISGDPDSCIAGLKQYEEAGADEVLMFVQSEAIPHEKVMASLELFGREVLPAFH